MEIQKKSIIKTEEILKKKPVCIGHSFNKEVPGLHILGDFYDCECNLKNFLDHIFLKKTLLSFVRKSDLTKVGEFFHKFSNGGVTGIIALAESHLSVHTWPENKYVTVDIYVCSYTSDNRPKAKKVYSDLEEFYMPKDKNVQFIERL